MQEHSVPGRCLLFKSAFKHAEVMNIKCLLSCCCFQRKHSVCGCCKSLVDLSRDGRTCFLPHTSVTAALELKVSCFASARLACQREGRFKSQSFCTHFLHFFALSLGCCNFTTRPHICHTSVTCAILTTSPVTPCARHAGSSSQLALNFTAGSR